MFHSTVGAAFWTALPAEIANHDCTASRAPVALNSKVADRVCRRSFQRRPKPDNWFPFPLVRQILRSILTPPEHTGAPLSRMAPADAGRGRKEWAGGGGTLAAATYSPDRAGTRQRAFAAL